MYNGYIYFYDIFCKVYIINKSSSEKAKQDKYLSDFGISDFLANAVSNWFNKQLFYFLERLNNKTNSLKMV